MTLEAEVRESEAVESTTASAALPRTQSNV